jgi:hypothetical protein
VDYDDAPCVPIVPSPPVGSFQLPIAGIPPAKQHVVKLRLNATIAGKQVEEGVDYTFDYDPTSPSVLWVTPLTAWDPLASITFDALVIEIVNLVDVPIPNTVIGFTPLAIGGSDPGFVRKNIFTMAGAKTEEIDRTVSLKVDADGLGTPYIYP